MKQFLLITLCLVIAIPVAMAFEMTEDQKKVLEPNLDKLLKCLEETEKTIPELQKAYDDAVANTAKVAAQPKKWYQKGIADPNKKAKKAELKAQKALKEAEAKVAVVKCDLKVMGKRELTEAELEQAQKELLGYMTLAQQAAKKAVDKAEKGYKKAVDRVERIPSEKTGAEAAIASHKKNIADLEASKAGKGWADKTSINAKIMAEKSALLLEEGKPAKLDKELVACEKVIVEYNELLFKQTALDVAIAFLNSGEKVEPVLPTIIEEEEGEEGEKTEPAEETKE